MSATLDPRTTTIAEAGSAFLDLKKRSRSKKTASTYRYGINRLMDVLQASGIDPQQTVAAELAESHVIQFIERMQAENLSAATQKLYCSALVQFYKFLASQGLASANMFQLEELIRQYVRRPGQRLPQFPKEQIELLLDYAETLNNAAVEDERAQRINLRDRAFLLTLADTGLRVHEACGLTRGEIDWNEGRAIIIGKGNKQAVVRFSQRSLRALKDYLAVRAGLDGKTGRRLASLPLFARHDDGGEKKVKPMSTDTGRNIVKRRVAAGLGPESIGLVTPHSFRHYFVTTILKATGGNIHVAQKLARHTSISVTERYAHLADDELDQSYEDVFGQSQIRSGKKS